MERAALASWLTPPQQEVFDRMHVADQRHGLDVVATLRTHGVIDREVLVAGLIHDAGKGETGIWPRVAYSLRQAYGPSLWRAATFVPGWKAPMQRLRDHAETSTPMPAAS